MNPNQCCTITIAFLCTVPAPIAISEEIEGILFLGDSSFFEFQLPVTGMTLRLEGQSGRSVMYASSNMRNPNSAFYDFRYDSQEDAGGLFVSADILGGGERRKRLVGELGASEFTDTTLYVTVQGLEDRNVFTMLTTFGNTCMCTFNYYFNFTQLYTIWMLTLVRVYNRSNVLWFKMNVVL